MRRLFVLALVVSLAWQSPAGATVVRPMDVDALARAATDVVVATVAASESRWDSSGQVILTFTELDVVESWKGARRTGDRVQMVRTGGVVGDVEMRVMGESLLEPGERAVLFLGGPRNNPFVVGLGQGKLPMRWDPRGRIWGVRRTRSLEIMRPTADLLLPVDAVRARVVDALRSP